MMVGSFLRLTPRKLKRSLVVSNSLLFTLDLSNSLLTLPGVRVAFDERDYSFLTGTRNAQRQREGLLRRLRCVPVSLLQRDESRCGLVEFRHRGSSRRSCEA